MPLRFRCFRRAERWEEREMQPRKSVARPGNEHITRPPEDGAKMINPAE